MRCAERRSHAVGLRCQSGAVVLLASAFVFLLSYIALTSVDLAAVEAKLAGALRQQITSRSLMAGAARVAVAREKMRLQAALEQGDEPVCDAAGFCETESQAIALSDSDDYSVSYRTRRVWPGSAHGDRRRNQTQVSSHIEYRRAHYEIDISVIRQSDSVALARAAVGLQVSAVRGEEK